MSFFVYILYSRSKDKYYIGSSGNINIRLEQHDTGRNTSTKYGIPWTMVYSEQHETLENARKRELEIKKKKSRKYIEGLVAQ
jgi:putative endonuclease